MGNSSDGMTGTTAGQGQVLAGHAGFLITTAARAPSVHNTQPWRFRTSTDAAGLQHDALAEGATLALVTGGLAYDRLERITAAAARRGDLSPRARAEIRRWTRTAAITARDGIPATALASSTGRLPGRLPQRDFDLGRGIARLPSGGAPPPATAVLLTPGDRRADWLRAGQALHRVLLHAASQWVFASLHTQPLEDAAARDLIRSRLALRGHPQMLLQLGPATAAWPTARRPPAEPDGP
jgi:nitroreductase